MADKEIYLECDCKDLGHLIRITHMVIEEKQPEFDMFCFHYYLDGGSFFKRLWRGIKFICGFKSKYGEFSETIINKKESIRLANFLLNPEGKDNA